MIRLLALVFISMVPVAVCRRFLYRKLFGFKIDKNAEIGMFNLLDIKTLVMEDKAKIRGIGNIFMNVHRVEMGRYSRIGGPRIGINLFRGTANKKDYPPSVLKIGKCSVIELFHYFDLCGDIIIGNNVVVGGIKSVFFTHSFHKPEFDPIMLGDNCYIGTNCLFQMGTRILNNSVVGMGSVITEYFEEDDCFIAGVPAKVIKKSYGFSPERAFQLRKIPFYKDGKVHFFH